MYCLRCQENLVPWQRPRCSHCGLQFDPKNPATYSTERCFILSWYLLPVLFLAMASGTVSYAAVRAMAGMGVALFISVPVTLGIFLGYATRAAIWLKLTLGVAAAAGLVLTLISANLTGLFCGLVGFLVCFGPVLAGVLMGAILRTILKNSEWNQRSFLPTLLILSVPYLSAAIERLFPRPVEVAAVVTETVFAASPEWAWNGILFYEEVAHQPPWLLRLALPRPVRAIGSKAAAGNVVYCVYERGHLVKEITAVEEPRLLAFKVVEQELHFERDVTLRGGSFTLEPCPGGNTRVVLTTEYERHLYPAWLWEPIEQGVVHTLHRHVLEGMRRRAVEAMTLSRRG
jgi:hypothetical protein